MKIALCMIVKDDSEVEGLKKALISAIDYVDSVHIVANGKKTADIEHLVGFTSSKYPQKQVEYQYLAWKHDFSEQRNFSFSLVPENTDFILWLDTDDVLVGGEYLRPLVQKCIDQRLDVVFLKYWYGCTFNGEPSLENLVDVDIEHYRERLIRPGTITWKKRIHETPVPVSGQKDSYTKVPYDPERNPIAVLHTATLEDSYIKLERNQKLLEKELEDERSAGAPDPRTILYLMKIYAEVGDEKILKQCIEMGHEYLGLSGWDEERATACDLIAICYSKLGNFHEAIKFLHSAIEEFPYEPLHYIRLSLAYFNVGRYKEAKHWLKIAGQMDIDESTSGIKNFKEMKVLFAQMALKISYNVDKDLTKAVEAAKLLYKEQPIPENKENLAFVMDLHDLYKASESAKELIDYLISIGSQDIINVLSTLPKEINEQPWAMAVYKEHTPPRVWKDNDICYFANFGGKHFERWDGRSIAKGIGGSETAVIKLAEEWTKKGYKVTVYGHPEEVMIVNGVTYKPWFHFNQGDKFNIFIQWRSGYLAPIIKARKFIVDLHDIVHQSDYSNDIMNAVDLVMFKSQYHRDLLPELPDHKALVVGNGI